VLLASGSALLLGLVIFGLSQDLMNKNGGLFSSLDNHHQIKDDLGDGK
jgi:hypothetical protein